MKKKTTNNFSLFGIDPDLFVHRHFSISGKLCDFGAGYFAFWRVKVSHILDSRALSLDSDKGHFISTKIAVVFAEK